MGKELKNKVREALEGETKVLYSAVVLSDESHTKLVSTLQSQIPEGWKVFAHHMTVVFGKGLPEDLKQDLGQSVSLGAAEIGMSDMAIAVKVLGYPSNNDIPHITVAVNTEAGGKPFMSNKITNWKPLTHINLIGVVTEIKAQ